MTRAVDLFAGLGGFTEGATRAGISVVWAGNHWQAAVDTHARNHPATQHECQDLRQTDWTSVPRHDLLLAAPACQGHSRARGRGLPKHYKDRTTAWAVVDCAEVHRPYAIVVENVVEFSDWILFPAWCSALQTLGYALSRNIVDAACYGVPQHRRRLMVIATRSRAAFKLKERRRPGLPIGPLLQWREGPWRRIDRTLAPSTLVRIRNGRREFGDRFVMPYYGSGSGTTGRSIHRPIGTITTKDRWAIVSGERMRMLNVPECKAAMAFRRGYLLPDNIQLAKHLLGNAVPPPLAAGVLKELVA